MSEQTTPETDGAEIIFSPLEGDAWVPASISRKLERERDEAREQNAKLMDALKGMIKANGGVAVMPTAEAKEQNFALKKAQAVIAKFG